MGSSRCAVLIVGAGLCLLGALHELVELCNCKFTVIQRINDGVICIFKIHKQLNLIRWCGKYFQEIKTKY